MSELDKIYYNKFQLQISSPPEDTHHKATANTWSFPTECLSKFKFKIFKNTQFILAYTESLTTLVRWNENKAGIFLQNNERRRIHSQPAAIAVLVSHPLRVDNSACFSQSSHRELLHPTLDHCRTGHSSPFCELYNWQDLRISCKFDHVHYERYFSCMHEHKLIYILRRINSSPPPQPSSSYIFFLPTTFNPTVRY